MNKKRIVVICPGRGSYSRENSKFLVKYGNSITEELSFLDLKRKSLGYDTITELDNQSFKSQVHMIGENASPLIYACSLADYYSIDKEKFEVVAVAGNSMGWYTALAIASSLDNDDSFNLIQTMGSMMKSKLIGGQIIYPIIDDNWKIDLKKREFVLKEIKKFNAYVSIFLGGYIVIGGDINSIKSLLTVLPKNDKYPFQIPFNGAFHTPLMSSIMDKVNKLSSLLNFRKPRIPIVDGSGKIWLPYSSDLNQLKKYTLDYQVNQSYDFSTSIRTCLREFCPDKIVLLGPGNNLGGAIAQIIIENNWFNVNSKETFKIMQNQNPFLISMSLDDQRKIVCLD